MSKFLQKIQNVLTKNLWVTGGVALAAVGLTVFAIWFCHTPSREISKAEFERLVSAKALKGGQLTPTPYAGIYSFEARHRLKGSGENVYISTHLEDYQIRELLESGQA